MMVINVIFTILVPVLCVRVCVHVHVCVCARVRVFFPVLSAHTFLQDYLMLIQFHYITFGGVAF
jgi:hypothetical protein